MGSQKKDIFVSVAAFFSEEGDFLEDFISETLQELKEHFSHFEILLIDGSLDESVCEKMSSLLKKHEGIRYIRLSQACDIATADSVALENAIGDFVVLCSPEFDPPGIFPEAIEECRARKSALFGVRKSRQGQGIAWCMGAYVFHWYCSKVLKLSLPENTTGFKVLRRKDVNALLKIKENSRYSLLIQTYCGFSWKAFEYKQIQRNGKSFKKPILSQIKFAFDIIIANSLHPLRFVSLVCVCISFLNLAYIGYVFGVYFLKEDVMEGWITISLQTSGLFFFVFLILAVLSEYIGRILRESQNRPSYFIQEEKKSNVLFDPHKKRNITHRSK